MLADAYGLEAGRDGSHSRYHQATAVTGQPAAIDVVAVFTCWLQEAATAAASDDRVTVHFRTLYSRTTSVVANGWHRESYDHLDGTLPSGHHPCEEFADVAGPT